MGIKNREQSPSGFVALFVLFLFFPKLSVLSAEIIEGDRAYALESIPPPRVDAYGWQPRRCNIISTHQPSMLHSAQH